MGTLLTSHLLLEAGIGGGTGDQCKGSSGTTASSAGVTVTVIVPFVYNTPDYEPWEGTTGATTAPEAANDASQLGSESGTASVAAGTETNNGAGAGSPRRPSGLPMRSLSSDAAAAAGNGVDSSRIRRKHSEDVGQRTMHTRFTAPQRATISPISFVAALYSSGSNAWHPCQSGRFAVTTRLASASICTHRPSGCIEGSIYTAKFTKD